MADNNVILITTQEETEIKNKAPDKMPLNPTAQGWSGQQVRATLSKFVVDDENSILRVLKDKLELIKQKLDVIDSILGNQANGVDFIDFNESSGLTQADIDTIGTLFYDLERHTFTFKTDLGEYHEIGSNLGDFGKNDNGYVFEGQVVTITGVQGASPIKEFNLANAGVPNLSKMVGVLTTSTNEDFSLTPGQIGKISVFGDVEVPDLSKVFDTNFLSDLSIESYSQIPFGTKLYLSTESGKYSAIIPPRPLAAIWVATVVYISPSGKHGRIFVYPHEERTQGSGIQTFLSVTQPQNMIEGDLWFKIKEEV